MNTLFISSVRPYPPGSGSPLRGWHNIRVLARLGPVSVFSFGEPHNVKVMPGIERWIHINEDEYPSGALSGPLRALRVVRPRQFPIQNEYVNDEINERLQAFIEETHPDVIVLSHWFNSLPRALRTFPRLIVDAHNIESFLLEDLVRSNQISDGLARRLQLFLFRKRERAMFRKAARVWVCSQNDADLLNRLDRGLSPPVIWPNVVDVDSYDDVRARTLPLPDDVASSKPTIVFVGYYPWWPNARAADVLIEEILPLVASRVPNVRLLLVGKEPTQRMIAAAERDSRIVVTGSVEDVRPYLAVADVSAIALTEGGGTRLKILEAFAAGIPVVSTSKGAEGIAAGHDREILIADTPETMADAIIEILNEPERVKDQVEAALALVRDSYSLQTLERQLAGALPGVEETQWQRSSA